VLASGRRDLRARADPAGRVRRRDAAAPAATSYRLNRGTAAGDEGATPIATTTNPTYTDTNLSRTTVYCYEVTVVNSAEESPRSAEDVSKTPPPVGTGGHTPGRGLSGNSQVCYGRTRFFTRSASGRFYLTF
jgi:hypothetical protein